MVGGGRGLMVEGEGTNEVLFVLSGEEGGL